MEENESPEIFISYARSSELHAKNIARTLEERGYSVWWDEDLPAHRAYTDVIEDRLNAARAVLVIWSADAAKSEWVRAEADAARHARKLVQLTIDGAVPPMPFNQIQCPTLSSANGGLNSPTWRKVESSIAELVHGSAETCAMPRQTAMRGSSICVLPFANISGDKEQEYFSDGITEDLITDLSRISALGVVARNTSFTFKGSAVEVTSVARQLDVSHVLEGSVRKAGNRLRITAQLVDGYSGQHLWAERYDRELADIFEIQDEISKAIVSALRLQLLPSERKALEQRGTSSPEAYDLYLLARQNWVSGNDGDVGREELIMRICERAIEIDPEYAHAWALLAMAQSQLQFRQGRPDIDGMPAAERAVALNPALAEARAVRARYLLESGRQDEAQKEIDAALKLDPESWEVNKVAAKLRFSQGSMKGAAACFRKAAELMEQDYHSLGMLMTCARGLGDTAEELRVAKLLLRRVEQILDQNPGNGSAISMGVGALAVLGEFDKAKKWVERALMIDPDNMILRYNLACYLASDLNDVDGALELLETVLSMCGTAHVRHVQQDPDMASLWSHPRFRKMVEEAQVRLNG